MTATGHDPESAPPAVDVTTPESAAAAETSGGVFVIDEARDAVLKRRLHRLVAFGALALLVAIAGVAGAIATSRRSNNAGNVLPPASLSIGAGDRAPVAFTAARLGGGAPIDIARLLHGHPAVVNFFGSWCPDCRAELGAFGSASHAYAGRVQFLGIDTQENDRREAITLLSAADARYPVAIDPGNEAISSAYGAYNLPATFFIDASGKVRFEVLGEQSRSALDERLVTLLRDSS